MLQHTTILDAAAATVTKDLSDTVLGQVRFARAIFLEINGGSTPNWTLDIQGKAAQGATWHNIDYFRTDQGAAVSPSAAQLAVNWTTARHYVIPEPPPFVRLVAMRTGGTLTVHGAFSSEAYSVPFSTVGAAPKTDTTSDGYGSATTVTRPANTTAYTANDVVGATAAAIDIGVMGPSGGEVIITSASLEIDVSAVPTGMTTFRLALYNVTPPSALADNAAFDIPAGDRASFLGFIDVGTPVDEGSTLFVQAQNINKHVTLAGTNLFAYLVTAGGFTPAGNSEVYKVTLKSVAV